MDMIDLPIKEIIEKYLAGKSIYELGKEYKVSATTVRNRLKGAGAVMRRAGGVIKKDLPIKELVEKYKAGKSAIELGKEYGVSTSTMESRLKGAGVVMRSAWGSNKKDLPIKELIVKYLSGKSTIDLGKEYEVSFQTINNRLKDAGLALDSNVTKRKQLNAHLINTLELNTLELAGA